MNIQTIILFFGILSSVQTVSCTEEKVSDSGAEIAVSESSADISSEIMPDGTYMFTRRDTCDLFLDIYEPAARSETRTEWKDKPTVIFAFGGSFARGTRDAEKYRPWLREMSRRGYRMISIDYRLGLKGYDKVGIGQVNQLDHAIHIAVEDMVSATAFILDNAEMLGVDPGNIVISGSSAGAITALQTDFELCNGTKWAAGLPEGFRYAGVMAFAGAVFSREGKLTYRQDPAPTLMLHGTDDSVVPYKQIKVFRLGFFGTSKITERFEEFGYPHTTLRYVGHDHEIAEVMYDTIDMQEMFLENSVMKCSRRSMDAYIDDPAIDL